MSILSATTAACHLPDGLPCLPAWILPALHCPPQFTTFEHSCTVRLYRKQLLPLALAPRRSLAAATSLVTPARPL